MESARHSSALQAASIPIISQPERNRTSKKIQKAMYGRVDDVQGWTSGPYLARASMRPLKRGKL